MKLVLVVGYRYVVLNTDKGVCRHQSSFSVFDKGVCRHQSSFSVFWLQHLLVLRRTVFYMHIQFKYKRVASLQASGDDC